MTTKSVIIAALGAAWVGIATGCLVPQSKYRAVEAERDRLAQLLEEKERDLSAAQDSFRKRFEDASRELELYKKQAGASSTEADQARKALEDAQKKTKEIEEQLKGLGIGEVRDGRLVLQGSLLFGLGEDAITSQGKAALDKIAGAFKSKDVLIQIDGHTDNTPLVKARTKATHGENLGLSAHRAIAVYRYLASKGIPERNMFVRGFGASWPVASNATPPSRAKNRRVEILFVPGSMITRSEPK